MGKKRGERMKRWIEGERDEGKDRMRNIKKRKENGNRKREGGV